MSELKASLEALRLRDEAPRPSRAKWVIVAAAVLVLSAGALWWARAGRLVEVETVRAAVQQTRADQGAPMLTASGYVVARRKAVVSAKIQGRLSELRVEEGSRVVEGETIARLESADYEANLVRARARVESVKLQIEAYAARIRAAEVSLTEARRQAAVAARLWKEQVGSVDERDATQARVAAAEAAFATAQADHASSRSELAQAEADVRLNQALLDNTVIKTPFTGTVVKKMAEVGESVAPIPPGVNISTASGAIVALADLDTLEVEVDVAESNVARLQPEQPAEVVVEAFPDKRYRAVLRQVIPTADRTKATVMVKVTIVDKDPDLKPEMSARVTFLERTTGTTTAASKPVVLVPQQAVITKDGQARVFEVAADHTLKGRAIVVGPSQQGQVVVREGLSGTETLVKRPTEAMKDGDAVKVKQ